MNFFVEAIALLIVTLSISLVIHPRFLIGVLPGLLKKKWLWPISASRIILGTIFIYISNSTNFPVFVVIFGSMLILAGVSIPLLGTYRIGSMVEWLINRKDYTIRMMGFVGMVLGITLALSGM